MASFYTQVKIDRTWSALKSYALANNSFIRYDTITNTDYPYYQIFVLDGMIAYVAVIYTATAPNGVNQVANDADKSDFETNYQNLTIKPQEPRTSDGYTKISGAGIAGTPNVGVVTVQGIAGGTAIPVSGTITATNPSVSTTGSAPPASATYIGGSVTTAAPTYTTGQMSALSLTTGGLLRVDGSSVTQPVSGTVAATQSGTWTVQPGNTANTTPWLATISQGGNSATVTAGNALKIDGSAVTQPVSGTVTANIGTSGSLALDATLTGGTQTTRITDGTNTATVKAASTAAVVGDKALVVAISPNNTVAVAGTVTANIGTTNGLALDATLAKLTIAQSTALGSNTQAMVGGSVTTAAPTYTTGNINPLSLTTAGALRIDGSGVTQPVSGTVAATQSGTWTVQPGNTANTTPWLATINQGGNSATVTASNALKVDGSAVTQPVSGTVTANAGTGSFTVVQATAANLNATVVGTTAAGSGAASGLVTVQGNASGTPVPVSGTVTATNPSVSTTGSAPPASATYVGGSVTTAAPTYTTGQMSALSLTTGGLLRIDGSGVTQPVSGTVTANAGTGNFTVVQGTAANLRAQTASESTTAAATGSVANLAGGAVTTAAPTYTTGQMNPLSLTTAGALRIDGSGATQPVSGTVAATQSGTWTVQPGNTANTTPWLTTISQGGNSATVTGSNALKVDGSAVTQPVSGTVTANIGTTNGLALDATLAKLTIAQGTALGTNTQAMVGGSVTTAAPTYTTGQISPLSLTTAGAIRIDGSGTTQPVSGTVTANQGGTWNITNISGTVSLPTGAATETSLAKLTLAQGSTTSGQTGALTLGAVTTAAPTYTTGQSSPLSLDTTGALRITGSITASNPSVSTTGSAPPASATYIGGSVTTAAPTYTTGQMSALSLTTAGALRIDGSGATQPVSGTVAATQSGTWTVQPGNTANTTPWLATISQGGNAATVTAGNALKIDGSAVTQPVSGAVTANIGTTNGLALDATVAKLTIAQGTALGTNTQAMVGGSVTTAAPTYTTGQISPLSLTTAGAIRIDGSGTTQPVSGTVTANQGGAPWSNNITQFGGVAVSTGTGASGTGIPRVTVANDSNILATQSGTWTATVTQATAANLNAQVVGPGAAAAAISGNPVRVGGSDGTNTRNILTDASGRLLVSGAAADGAAVTGNPVLMAGQDGTNAQSILTDTTGRQVVVGGAADGAAATGNPVLVGGTDGTNAQSILTDTIGRIITSPTYTASTTIGVADGFIATATNGLQAVRATTYTEPASNAQRSVSSSSASDASAGTGARTIKLTYYTSTYTGPFTETITMNGTTAVNTVSTTICFIEKIEVVTVGSNASNVGTISLFGATAGGGGTVGTIAIGDNNTFWSHHYIATGKTCRITNTYLSNNANQAMQFIIKYRSSTANAAETNADWIRPPFSSNNGAGQRFYDPPLLFAGPGRVVSYVKPDNAVTATYYSAFDFYEE